MEEKDSIEALVEERDAQLLIFNGSQQPINRKGLFLKPTSTNSLHKNPTFQCNSTISKVAKFPRTFRWWADPQLQWDAWIEKLRPKYTNLWRKAGIFDAIMASKYKTRRDQHTLLGASRFWCGETNTFIFPWGEATVTLEDVMILGGFSVLGEPVRVKEPLGGVFGRVLSKMNEEMSRFKSKYKKAAVQALWMRHYMRARKGDKIEHIAFLSLWLSRFVLISSNRFVRQCVFQVAVRLASGMKIALAPVVLASIYGGLRLLKDRICTKASSAMTIWAPFNIVQMWLWERFLALGPGLRNLTNTDMPRAARWTFSGKPLDLSSTMHILESPDEFQWRPYAIELENWRMPSFYVNDGRWFHSNGTQDGELRAFACCLRDGELVGLDCIELYQPHRVAMQFGFDQDIPNFSAPAISTWEEAWITYDISLKNVKFYVPQQLFKSGVTLEYSNWWRNIQRKVVGDEKKRKNTHTAPDSMKKKVKGVNGTDLSRRPALRHHEIDSKDNCCKSQQQRAHAQTELTQPLKSSETMSQNSDVTREEKLSSVEKQMEEELGLDPMDINEEGTTEVVEGTNIGDPHCDPIVIEQPKVENEKQLEEESQPEPLHVDEDELMKCSFKTVAEEFELVQTMTLKFPDECDTEEERDRARKEELERDMKIKELKKDISSILAKIKYLESLSDSQSEGELISSPS